MGSSFILTFHAAATGERLPAGTTALSAAAFTEPEAWAAAERLARQAPVRAEARVHLLPTEQAVAIERTDHLAARLGVAA